MFSFNSGTTLLETYTTCPACVVSLQQYAVRGVGHYVISAYMVLELFWCYIGSGLGFGLYERVLYVPKRNKLDEKTPTYRLRLAKDQ